MLKRAIQKIFLKKFKLGIKNAEFHADFKSVEKVLKKFTTKSYFVAEIFTFSIFLLMFIKIVWLITFFGEVFKNFFNVFEISMKVCVC